jgi:predicted Zn finger-like uncharacterized protein
MPVRISCPACNKALRVPDDSLGRKVRCPACTTAFTAEAPAPPPEEEGEAIQTAPSSTRAAPQPGPGEEEDEGIQTGPVPKRKRRPAQDEEQEDEDAPRRGRRRGPSDSEFRAKRPHRGPVMLALGIAPLVFPVIGAFLFACCGALGVIFFGLLGVAVGGVAWIVTARDLAAMRRGEMDFAGEGQTKFGVACAMCGTAASALCIVCGGILLVVALGLFVTTRGH